jgi:hypothetical protein
VQVVRAEDQRPVQREFLGQVGERVHGAELQARVAGHGDRAPTLEVPAVPAGQQFPDRRPPRIRCRPGAAEHRGDQPERPGPLQLRRPGRRHPQAAAPRLLQRVLEQARLADAGLAVDQHDGQAASRRPVDGVVQDRGLGLTTPDTRDRRQHPQSPDADPVTGRPAARGRRPGGRTVKQVKYRCAHELTLLWVLTEEGMR